MLKAVTYLNFDGRCEEALGFYAGVLGGEIVDHVTFGGTPMADHVPPEWAGKTMHAQLKIPGGATVMGSDAPPGRYMPPQGFFVSLAFDGTTEAERVFAALAEGGAVMMPIAPTFWAARFGILTDRFGVPWMVNCESGAA